MNWDISKFAIFGFFFCTDTFRFHITNKSRFESRINTRYVKAQILVKGVLTGKVLVILLKTKTREKVCAVFDYFILCLLV